MNNADLYAKMESLGVRVEYQEPDWILTRISDGRELDLGDLSSEQESLLADIQREHYWPTPA